MIYFDHTYTADPKHKFLHRLERAGFKLSAVQTEHPGKQFCRFIELPNAETARGKSYLEFVNVGRGGKRVTEPGVSFGVDRALEKHYQEIIRSRDLEAAFSHKNYHWKENSRSRLPGWNFLFFKNRGFRGFYPWMTEYEPYPGASKKRSVTKHENGIKRMVGLEMTLNEAGMEFLGKMLNRRMTPTTKLGCGTHLYLTLSTRNRIKNVILESRSLTTFLKRYEVDEVGVCQRQKCATLVNPVGQWNVVII